MRALNPLNRLLAILVFITVAAGAAIFALLAAGAFEVSNLQSTVEQNLHLHPHGHLLYFVEDSVKRARRDPLPWIAWSSAVAVMTLLLCYLELWFRRSERTLVLYQDSAGLTLVNLSALDDLARWVGEDLEGVEAMPVARVQRTREGLLVRGVVLLSPFLNARTTLAGLQTQLQERLGRAAGLPVKVRLVSRFLPPGARRRVR